MAAASRTIGSRLDETGGVGPGFDTVRLALALGVLLVHTSLLAPYAPGLHDAPLVPFIPVPRWALDFAVLPMFFAVSGFLVAGSAERLPLGRFLINRGLRIFPALIAVTLIAAFLLGPALTTFAPEAYFADDRFWSFLLNAFGVIRYELPGVFAANPLPDIVNGALWTIPHELSCYVIIAVLVMTGLYRRRGMLLAATVGLYVAAIVIERTAAAYPGLPFAASLDYALVSRGAARLVPAFLTGMVIYRYRHAILISGALGWGAAGAYLALCVFGSSDWQSSAEFNAIASPLLAYAVIAAGLSKRLRLPGLKADYSYGVYVSGYPIQQTILALVPGLQSVALFFALSAAASLAYAALSWRLVEKPALELRRRGARPRQAATVLRPSASRA